MTRGASRAALATVGALAIALLGPLAPARAADPVVAIDWPPTGAQVVGAVEVLASGDTGGPVAESIELVVDGTAGPSQPCTEGGATCSVAIPWDATGLPDVATVLEVRLHAEGAVVATSVPVAVDVRNPVPTVEIDAPDPDAVRSGSFTVDVTASIDPALTETTVSLTLLADDLEVATVSCPAASTCAEPLVWDATGQVGTRVLTVALTTSRGRTAISDGVPVLLTDPVPTVAITSPLPASSVLGPTEVAVSASVPDPLTEFPESVVLLVDGSPSGDPFSCPAGERVCAATFSWDATGLGSSVELAARVVTTRAREATSDVVTVTPDNPAPTVVITSPLPASSVLGPTEVAVSASVPDPLTEFPESVVLLVDGSPSGDPFSCPAGERVCAATFSWDATGLGSSVELAARVVTTRAREATSDVVTVTPDNPAPTVAITSPLPASSVLGATEVAVSGSTDESLTESVAQIEVLADGVVVGALDCVPAASACAGSVSWDATGSQGDVVLTAVLTTTLGRTATSDPVTVTAADPAPTVSITSPVAGAAVVGVTEVAVSASVDADLTESLTRIEVFAAGEPVAVVDCLAGSSVCAGTVSWDATGLVGPVDLTAVVTTSRPRTATSAAVPVSTSSPLPSVSISAPTAGTAVVGRVSIAVAAGTDPRLTEHPTSITVRDGSTVIGTVPCGTATTCAGTVTWDTTLLTGTRTLRATVSTDRRASAATSAPVAVTAATPRPTVVITAPTAGTVVSGTSSAVSVLAATDVRRSDVPRTITLRVDGVVRATATCTGSAHSCTPTLRWNPSAYAGAQVLTVGLVTSAGAAVVSAPRTVYAASDARLTASRSRTVDHRAATTVAGTVLATTTGAPVAGVGVRLVLDPARGDTRVVDLRTDDRGRYSLTIRPATRTQVTVRSVATAWLGPARTARTIDVRAPLTCSVDRTRLAPGRTGTGSCSVPGLPVGTPLALRYVLDGEVVTFARGTSRSTTIPFSFAFPGRGSYSVLVVVGRSSVYARTVSRPLGVTVR